MTCRYNEVTSRALSLGEQPARVSGTIGRRGTGRGDEQSARGLMLAIEVPRFGSNWQPLKRFRGRAGVEAA